MRTRLSWVLSALGVLMALFGAVVMAVLGPDSRLTTGPHRVETDATVVVTSPRVISWANVQVDILAEVPVRKPIFVGIANSVDVADYVGETQRLEVTSFSTPWKLTTRSVDGDANLPGAATAVDWWIESAAGRGGASISTRLPDETVSVAILSVGSSNLSGLTVTLAYGVKGGFVKGAGLVLAGLGMLLASVLWRRRDRDWDDEDTPDDLADESVDGDEEVIYVYVDDDGTEREISAEEAAALEVIEEQISEEIVAIVPSEVEVPPEEPEPVMVPEVSAGPGTDPEPEGEQVVYVYVDEDGVEHEVSEEELAEFEILHEEDDS